jgi:TRAF3-interacting protein 1
MDLPSLIAKTHSELGTLISKPALTDQLLSKPPFRFIHDIVSAVTLKTGFAAGLFSGSELDAHAIKEKQEKIDYLAKLIDHIQRRLGGITIDVRPGKLVAGLEPEGSNLMLQVRRRRRRRRVCHHAICCSSYYVKM